MKNNIIMYPEKFKQLSFYFFLTIPNHTLKLICKINIHLGSDFSFPCIINLLTYPMLYLANSDGLVNVFQRKSAD